MCNWKECISCCFGMKCFKSTHWGIWSYVSFKVFPFDLLSKDLSINFSGMLKSPTGTVLLLISLCTSVNICFIYLGASVLVTWMYTRVISSFWIDPFIIMKSLICLLLQPLFKSVLFDVLLPAIHFPFSVAWNIFFYPYTFSLWVSLDLKQVCCRQLRYGSCFWIDDSATLCLLIGAFRPFPFKVIINRYVIIAINCFFNHFLPFFSVPFLLSCSLLFYVDGFL